MARAGDLEDGGSFAAVVGAYLHLVQAAALERLVRPGKLTVRVERDRTTAGERERRRAAQPGDCVAVLAIHRRLAIGVDPLDVVMKVDQRDGITAVDRGPTPVGVHARAVLVLP